MSKINFSDSLICDLFESDFKSRIDSLNCVLNSEVAMQIVFQISFNSPRFRRFFRLHDRLSAKMSAYYSALRCFQGHRDIVVVESN